MSGQMPKPTYTTVDSVKVRLANKVQFQSGSSPVEGEIPNDFLLQLILDAEVDVEMDLRARYKTPFQSITNGHFDKLPEHTKRAIRKVVDHKAVMNVMQSDFGRGTAISGEGLDDKMSEKYEEEIMRLLGKEKIGEGQEHYRFKNSPPLDDLQLAKSNAEADDGYRGMIINTDGSCNSTSDYAREQINDPSRSYIGRRGFGNGGSY